MVRQAFQLPNGDDFFVSNSDTLFVLANVNADRARIYGFSLNMKLNFGNDWSFQSSLNFTEGRRSFQLKDEEGNMLLDTLVPQDHIPPLYGKTSLNYQRGKWQLRAVAHYQAAKPANEYAVSAIRLEDGKTILEREGSSDNIEQGVIDPLTARYRGTYAWTTFNLYSSYRIHKNLSLNFGVENILDIHYRTFSSGISAPGQNIIVGIKGHF